VRAWVDAVAKPVAAGEAGVEAWWKGLDDLSLSLSSRASAPGPALAAAAAAARADRTDEASLPHQAAALALQLLDLAAADDGSARRPPSPPSASSVAESYALAFATDLDAAADAGDGGLLGRAAAVLAAGGGGDWGAAAAPSPAAMVDGV
jgi:hypothetical protein